MLLRCGGRVSRRSAGAALWSCRCRCISSNVRVDTSTLEVTRRNELVAADPQRFFPSMTQWDDAGQYTRVSVAEFSRRFGYLTAVGQDAREARDRTSLHGRIRNIRLSGKKICFIDLVENEVGPGGALLPTRESQTQIIVNFSKLQPPVDAEQFANHIDLLRRNDYVRCVGVPGVSASRAQNLSLICEQLPDLLAPIQSPLPSKLLDQTKINNNRVVQYQICPTDLERLVLRSKMIQLLRTFLTRTQGFIEVETPILSAKANGANATPFSVTTKFDNKNLELRVAPELWLKRLIISGLSKIFEIGKVFRNEGIDSTHNPEFTMLEFYQTYASMEDLIRLSQDLFKYVLLHLRDSLPSHSNESTLTRLIMTLEENDWQFKRVEFLTTLSAEMERDFTSVDLNNARELLKMIPEETCSVLFPGAQLRTLSPPQILNKLCSHYIEDRHCQSIHPTLIYHHPLAMSPLAKTNPLDPQTTKRFELFIEGKEYVNAYEEENCPSIQLQNFMKQHEQQLQSRDNELLRVDHGYIEAMKSGMPPTGGFGLGVDRLCMLLLDADRIEEVLPFGSLDDVNRQ